MLQVFGQVGVVAGHQGQIAALGEPDAPQTQHRRVDHMHQIRAELL